MSAVKAIPTPAPGHISEAWQWPLDLTRYDRILFWIHGSWPPSIDAAVFPIGSVTGAQCFFRNSAAWQRPLSMPWTI